MARYVSFFSRVACVSLLLPMLAGCLYDDYLPRYKSAKVVHTPKPELVTAKVVMPADFSPYYQDLSYQYVTVRGGDTLSRLAARSNVPVKAVVAMNNMRDPYRIYPGQQLKVPAFHVHSVRAGETLYAISRVYDVEMSEVAHFNFLETPYTLMPGTKLKIPMKTRGEVRVASTDMSAWPAPKPAGASTSAQPVKTVLINSKPQVVALPPPPQATPAVITTKAAPKAAPAPAKVEPSYQTAKLDIPPVPTRKFTTKAPPKRSGKSFGWPVEGQIISGFGKKKTGFHNDGLNIAVKEGTPIRAAENGVVSYVGNEMRSFGNLILVSHADGYVTAYGHTERAAVAKGDAVKKGEVIAYAGSSGSVTRSQLHFEIRKKGRAINPVAMLD
ncbi:LysM peptidoglycan-binding domain-containing M23 family metallopeptidase [Sneathiella sp.]|uniref:LysM peptidoglycan-binding domain-containing M23 family metallopeptidase n=1 Tax=Sneathiella sp. TaxID=1964365 RepID=UPI0026259D70|nr:LysM peptidoglycan-binding domain-containing M23 family metallopeptidase [Sneathiella sp.]MDF2367300.1 LysM peptidoglycan-binding domain-containing M23 family metallopeptidase [Sneathiella sp.]